LIERKFVRKRRHGIGAFGSHCLHVGAPDEAVVGVFASLCVFDGKDIGSWPRSRFSSLAKHQSFFVLALRHDAKKCGVNDKRR
jgi:hypothetical protein